jgi:hypothetical protein
MLFVVQDGLSGPRLYRPARPPVLYTRPPRSIPHNEPIALRQLQRRDPHQPPRYQSGALLLHELCRRVQPRGCITDLTPEDVGVFGESFLQGADAQLPPERRPIVGSAAVPNRRGRFIQPIGGGDREPCRARGDRCTPFLEGDGRCPPVLAGAGRYAPSPTRNERYALGLPIALCR